VKSLEFIYRLGQKNEEGSHLSKFLIEVDGSEATEAMGLMTEIVQGLRQAEDMQDQLERIERTQQDIHKMMVKLCNSKSVNTAGKE
jgi:hypothetical protein